MDTGGVEDGPATGGLRRPSARRGPRDERGVLAARIVEVARDSFARRGLAGTTIRQVARDAGVDQALVHHYFGSKRQLFNVCLQPPPGFLDDVAAVARVPLELRGAAMIRLLVSSWEDPDRGPVLGALIQTAAHEPLAHDRLVSILSRQMQGVVSASLESEGHAAAAIRSGLCSSQLVGIAMVRYVWRIEPLASLPAETLVTLVGPVLQHYLTDPL